MDTLILERAYLPNATIGYLTMPSGALLHTIERPWQGNQRNVSCFPEGVYRIRTRPSGVVSRSSGGEYTEGWEVCDVPERTYIMIHPGNTIDDLEGCIAPGLTVGTLYGKPAVLSSRDAFSRIMDELSEREEWNLDVRTKTVSYP